MLSAEHRSIAPMGWQGNDTPHNFLRVTHVYMYTSTALVNLRLEQIAKNHAQKQKGRDFPRVKLAKVKLE